tara:strand:+ start:55225 stop:56010 length:786 start_codon:yes stop_codon:yes gene_type:complete
MEKLYHLSDRALLGIDGRDSTEFLQSVITNDIFLVDTHKAIYAAHLTPKGKFLYDFFISKMGDMYVLDCHKDELMPLAKSLHGYIISKDISLHDLSADYTCISSSNKNAPESVLSFKDPRHEKLGYRHWVKDAPADCENAEAYHIQRIKLGIIDGAFDGLKERSLINEMGFEGLNGVSFNKGCYVGQELTARTKFRTEPKKKVFQISFSGTAQNGDIIKCGNMDAGWIFSNYEGHGIAMLRTRYLDKEMTLNDAPIQVIEL